MLSVILTVDCERFISFSQINPRWNRWEIIKGKINGMIKNFRYNKKGFEIVYRTLIENKYPATLMLVGKIFDKEDILKKAPNFIEIGYHTENHLPLTLVNDEIMRKEIKNKWGVKSITAPMWMNEDTRNPSRIFKEMKKQGYTHTIYRGENTGIKHNHFNTISVPIDKYGVTALRVSACFEGSSKKKELNKIKSDIIKHQKENKVYVISTHDFTHKNNKNLLKLIFFLKRLEGEGKIKIKRLNEI